MILDRLQLDLMTPNSMDVNDVEVDTLHIDLRRRDYDVLTSGGEYQSSCECCGDIDIGEYWINIDDISLAISPKTALSLYQVLGDHLKACGHNV